MPQYYTLCPKNVTRLTCCNLTCTHERILTIFDRSVIDKIGNQTCFIFPPHHTSVSTLPSKTKNPEITLFHLMNAVCCLANIRRTRHVEISLTASISLTIRRASWHVSELACYRCLGPPLRRPHLISVGSSVLCRLHLNLP